MKNKVKRALSPKRIQEREVKRIARRKLIWRRNMGRNGCESVNNRDELDKLTYLIMSKNEWQKTYVPVLHKESGEIIVYSPGDPHLEKAHSKQVWSYVFDPVKNKSVLRSGFHPGRVNKGYILCKKGHEFKGIEVSVT
ncbi:MAG: hypothetical protein QM504_03465 [Pseudomonadota bacterium]